MVMTDKRLILIEAIKKELVEAKAKHVQCLVRFDKKNHQICIKFTSIDSPVYEKKIDEIANRYCESLMLIKQTKTTRTYAI